MKKNIKSKSAAASVADNSSSQTPAPATAAPAAVKRPVGRPREKFTKVIAFTVKDGAITRRGKGKPSPAVAVKYFSVPWDFSGSSLPAGANEAKAPKKKAKAKVIVTDTPVDTTPVSA